MRHYRVIVAAVTGVLAMAASFAAGPRMNPLDGLIYDLSLTATPRRPGIAGEPVAVVALDAASLDSPELKPTPRVFFGPVWASLISGLADSGAKAIGFDVIFAYSANRFPGFDGQYDKDFLIALNKTRDRVVLAQSVRQGPARPFIAAVYDPATDAGRSTPRAFASIEMFPDADGVQRRVPSSVENSATLAAALLDRAGRTMSQQVLLAPNRPLETTPTYGLVDVLRCLKSDPAGIRQAFAGKIVLVGTTLPDEDRKTTPDRFFTPPPPRSFGESCSLARLGASDPGSHTVAGIFVHAAAIEQVLNGELVEPMPRAGRMAEAALAGIAGAAFGFLLSPWLAATASTLLALALFGIAVLALPLGLWVPVAIPAGSGGAGTVLAYVMRFVVEERQRRRVQRAFSHYLAPSIVDRLTHSEADLRLGGERRDVSVMFADLSGFTALSGRVGPEELMAVTNAYLGHIVGEVERTGGYVDKFIGDAVMGIWGAPVADADHATHAANAALAILNAVGRAKAEHDAAGHPGYSVKMGLNTGPAVIGNVGAPGRYNYTAIGETVNIAARLEGVPQDYNCAIMVGPATAEAIAGRFVVCELDWVKVKGKEEPLAVYELVAEKDGAGDVELAYPTVYATALALYRAGEFAAAETAWRAMAYPRASPGASTPPLVMASRCAELTASPPAAWDGVFVKSTK